MVAAAGVQTFLAWTSEMRTKNMKKSAHMYWLHKYLSFAARFLTISERVGCTPLFPSINRQTAELDSHGFATPSCFPPTFCMPNLKGMNSFAIPA